MTIFSINGTNLFPVKVPQGNFVPFKVDFTGGSNTENVDLTILYHSNLFATLTTIFIDNSTNPNSVNVTISGTNQTFVAPAYSNGFYGIAATTGSMISLFSVGGATSLANVQLYDYFIPSQVWLTEPAGSGEPITAPDGAIVTLGSKVDAAITNPASSATLIALTKGMLTNLNTLSTGAGVTGAVTSVDGGLVTVGLKADMAVTNPASSGSVIALLKGLLTSLASLSVTSSMARVTWTQTSVVLAAATSTQILAANANRKALRWMINGINPVTVVSGAGPAVAGTGFNYNGNAGVGQQGGGDTFGDNEVSTQAFQAISTLGSNIIVWEGV